MTVNAWAVMLVDVQPAGQDQKINKLRVIVADDDPTIQRAIEWILRRSCDVIGKVGVGEELVEAALALQPDVIVTDTMSPALFGSHAIQRPGRRGRFRVVLISDEPQDLRQWIDQGAGCVVHTMDLDSELVTAVEAAAACHVFISCRAIACCCDGPKGH